LLYRLGITPRDQAPGPRILARVLEGEVADRGRRALDVGCGKGRDAIHLAKNGREVTAVDLDQRAADTARERAAEQGADVRWIVGDVTKLGTLAAPPGYTEQPTLVRLAVKLRRTDDRGQDRRSVWPVQLSRSSLNRAASTSSRVQRLYPRHLRRADPLPRSNGSDVSR
jgi:SAM-dependent methyltransferase